ncbi:MAG: diaminopimelate epimerase [Phycisphaerales bacterium]|nr:diaminopimelate epimerase [Phycisphaerales bacterium]
MSPDLPSLTFMQGTGNRFALVDEAAMAGRCSTEVVQALAAGDPSRQVDGLLILGWDDPGVDVTMTIVNADGSVAGMCGNGLRCVAFEAHRRGRGHGRTLHVRVGDHRLATRVLSVHGEDATVCARLPAAQVEPGCDRALIRVHVGNRHGIVLCSSLPTEAEWSTHVGRLQDVGLGGYNLHAVCIMDRSTISMRSWERGVGPTAACASGATATVAALASRGLVEPVVDVQQVGGVLRVRWRGPQQELMTMGGVGVVCSTSPAGTLLEVM